MDRDPPEEKEANMALAPLGAKKITPELDVRYCLEVFPMEVWQRILLNLKNEDLLACRLVCRDLMCLVDDEFEGNVWKPYFPKNRNADVLSLFMTQAIGTRFTCGADVNSFIEYAQGFVQNNENPFINHTMILHCRSTGQYNELCQRFTELVDLYGQFVRHCLYFVHYEVIASIKNIPEIFRLANLRSLTIYCADWDKPSIRTVLDQWTAKPFATPHLRHFFSLNLLGDRGYMVIKQLFKAYGPQIKRLNCWGHCLMEEPAKTFANGLMETLPNLEEFKINQVSGAALSLLSNSKWPLKRLAVRVASSDNTDNLGRLMKSFFPFRLTLESFHFQLDRRSILDTACLHYTTFPRVTDLRIPYYYGVSHGPNYITDWISQFKNLKRLQMVNSERTPIRLDKLQQKYESEMTPILDLMWRLFPPGLEQISLRYRVFSQERNSNVSVVTKYERNELATTETME